MEVVEGCGVSEVEYWRKRAEERCRELELEIVKRKSEYEALEVKFQALEAEKLSMEEELMALKRGSGEIKEKGNGGGAEKGMEIVVDLDEGNSEEDMVFQLMVENEVLECEKKKAESEVETWKGRFKELEAWVLKLDRNVVFQGGGFPLKLTGDSLEVGRITQGSEGIEHEEGLKGRVGMESSRSKDIAVNVVDLSSTYHSPGKGICHPQAAGTHPNVTFDEHGNGTKERRKSGIEYGKVSQASKQLEFKEDRSPCKKIAPSTPGGNKPYSLSVIDISDSDDELIADNKGLLATNNPGSRKICISSDSVIGDLAAKYFLKQAHTDNNDQEDVDSYNEKLLAFSTPKRKRASNVVTSDSESSDDNIPISRVKRMHFQERKHDQVGCDGNGSLETATASVVDDVRITSPKRHLVRLRKSGGRDQAQRNSSQTSETAYDQRPNKDVEEDEPKEVESESEGESLDGFIVNSYDVSESNDASSESNSVSDDDVNFENVLSKLQRNKDHNTWEFEADILAAFGKNPDLCMRAVCALYRQQTAEEKQSRETLLYNYRGFSKFDALRGSKLAEFLTDGDPNGDLSKTVEELEEHNPEAIETCRTLATRYSKQLFEIYKNKEDPLFLP